MGGFDDHVATLGDWIAPSPSPRTFFSTILDDDIDLKENTDENKMGIAFTEPEEPFLLKNVDMKDGAKTGIAIDRAAESKAFTEQRVGSHVGLLERIAARAGFNAPRLITDSIKHDNLSQNPEVRSPYLTIPPGLSPTTLLDSPVFLSDAQIQASPTTGKFQSALSGNNRSSLLATGAHDKRIEGIPASSFALKRIVESSPPFFHTADNKVTQPMLCRSTFYHNVKASNQLESSVLPRSMEPSKGPLENETAVRHVQDNFSKVSSGRDTEDKTLISESRIFDAVGGSGEYSPPLDDQQEEDVDQRGSGDACAGGVQSEDAYNWRKYGQKQVKGSEYPRSYYKCTHPNCPVKKKVERSHEGHITEIIYKGAHNHPKPPPNRRSALTSLISPTEIHIDSTDQVGPDAEVDPLWTAMQRGISTGGPDWGYDNLEVKSLVSLGGEYCDASTSFRAQNGSQFEAGDAIDGSPTFSNDEDENGTNGSASLGYNGEGYESESKRRKLEAYSTEMSGATRAIREPRVVVQTTSDVDILDDGYRWRKYGQKVVKGNPNPRSYYKCTSSGCTVRKHVERASHDLKSVITTYEGKHNHDVPAARNSSHTNSSLHNSLAAQTSVVWRHVHGPEPSLIHSRMTRYEMPPPLTSFGLLARDQLAPSQGFAFRTNPPELTNLAMAGLGPNHNKLPILPAHSYMGQPRPLNNMGFMLPKGEPKVEPMSEHNVNIPIGSSVYHQMMSRLPLGPQM